jgi:hypothetical protein
LVSDAAFVCRILLILYGAVGAVGSQYRMFMFIWCSCDIRPPSAPHPVFMSGHGSLASLVTMQKGAPVSIAGKHSTYERKIAAIKHRVMTAKRGGEVAYFVARILAHRFRCAAAIQRLPATDIFRRGALPVRVRRVPASTTIACSSRRISSLISSIMFSIFIVHFRNTIFKFVHWLMT